MRRTLVVAVSGLAAFAGFAAAPGTASAKRRPLNTEVTEIFEFVGLQGQASGDSNVPITFVLTSRRPRLFDVEAQFGIDRNADGVIGDDEFRPCTEDRLDLRDTRANLPPQLFRARPAPGAPNLFVWKSRADLGPSAVLTLEYQIDSNGRLVPDPANQGSFLFAPISPGIQVRLRALRGHRRTGPWKTSTGFGLDNRTAPSMEFDGFETGTPVTIRWTVFDGDSEDLNGNGVLDVADGEDMNGNGQLDAQRCGVAFDWHRVAEGQDPAVRTDAELGALEWSPCTRKSGAGDTDSLEVGPSLPVPSEGDLAGLPSAPPGVGRHWTFVWDVATDAGPGDYIVRARPFDESRAVGAWVYSRTVVRGGE